MSSIFLFLAVIAFAGSAWVLKKQNLETANDLSVLAVCLLIASFALENNIWLVVLGLAAIVFNGFSRAKQRKASGKVTLHKPK